MDNGIYITLSRQLAMFRDMAITANNIANANTTGYNSEHILFTSFLKKDVNRKETNPMQFDYDISSYRITQTGPVKSTGNPLDLAITGEGYFAVETPLGTRYTKAGNFQLDELGTLITASGYPVLNNNGQRIIFPEETQEITVGSAGNIAVNGSEFDSIGIHAFANEQSLEQTGAGLFVSEVNPEPAENVRVLQGALEGANVQPVQEMTRLIDISRSTSNTAKLIETMYDLQRKASNVWTKQG